LKPITATVLTPGAPDSDARRAEQARTGARLTQGETAERVREAQAEARAERLKAEADFLQLARDYQRAVKQAEDPTRSTLVALRGSALLAAAEALPS
jgi:hypothetical protein